MLSCTIVITCTAHPGIALSGVAHTQLDNMTPRVQPFPFRYNESTPIVLFKFSEVFRRICCIDLKT